MTNAEAIKTLHELWRETNDSWYEEVYGKAIKALEAQDSKTRRICDTCKHNSTSNKKWPCVDCDMREPADRWEPKEAKKLDAISRQAAIDILDAYQVMVENGEEKPYAWARLRMSELPSAEKPFKLPEIYVAEGFDTVEDEDGNVGFGVYVPDKNQIYVAGDIEDEIRARALLHEVCHWVQDMYGRPFDEDEANEFSDIVYDALSPAQPEIIRCKNCKHRHLDGMIWDCPFGLSGGEDFFCAYGAKDGDSDDE